MSKYISVQTIAGVRKVLKSSPSPYVELFRSLLDSSMNGPLKTKTSAAVKLFGPHELDFPQLGKNQSPYRKVPSVEEVRDIMLQELEAMDEGARSTLIFLPPQMRDNGEDDATVVGAVELITNITNNDYRADGYLPNLYCRALDEMCASTKQRLPGSIFELPTTCTVLPNSHLIELQHQNESTGFITLLSGQIVWIVWPPTEQNLNTLQQAYEAFAVDSDLKKLDVAQDMNGGVAFVQQSGEGLRLPPFCPVLGLVKDTTVLAKYSVVTADSFLSMCRKIPLYKAWWKTEADAEEKQDRFVGALLDCFEIILGGEFDSINETKLKYPITAKGPLLSLLGAWDEIKTEIISVMDQKARSKMEEIWTRFLNRATTRRCLICGEQCRTEESRNLSAHFQKKH